MEQGKLKPQNAFGYGMMAASEAMMYQFVNGYLLLFLTSVVCMGADDAGLVVSVGMLFETVSSLVFGKMSDACTSPKGRRRPFILVCSLTIPVVIALMYTNFSSVMSARGMMIAYLILNSLFWIGHGAMYIPYMAFGAEITTDYDDRTKLRSLCSGISIIGSYLGTSAPLLLVAFLGKRGMDGSGSWFWTGLVSALFIGGMLLLGWKLTAGVEKMPPDGKFEPMKALMEVPLVLKDYWELLKLKTMKILIVFKVLFNVGNAFFTSVMVFFLKFRLGMNEEEISMIYTAQIAIRVVNVFVISWIALKVGKTATLLGCLALSGVACVFFFVTGIDNSLSLMIFILITTAAISSFWQIAGAIFDDVTEVDEFVFGKRREGAINSLQSGIGSIATAAIYGGFGIYLANNGFDATVMAQPESALLALDQLFILMPGVCLLVACVVLMAYPLNKRRFHSLQSALRLKKAGQSHEQYQMDLDKIL